MVIEKNTVFENPIDHGNYQSIKLIILAYFVFGALLCVLYSSILPIIPTAILAFCVWMLNWYRMIYLNPTSVLVGEMGISVEFRYKKGKKFIPWQNVKMIKMSRKPNTVAEAMIDFYNMNAVLVTKDIAMAVSEKYQKAMGRPPPSS